MRARLDRRDALLAAIVALVAVGLELIWLARDGTEPGSDAQSMLWMAVYYRDALPHGLLEQVRSLHVGAPYPPLVPLLAALHMELLPGSPLALAQASFWPLQLLGSLALFLGVRAAGGGRLTATVAVAAAAALLLGQGFLHGHFMGGNAMFWLMPPSVALLVASDGFTRPGLSAVLGVVLALGLLSKWSFAFFLGPPMAVAVVVAAARLLRPWPLRLALGALCGGGLAASLLWAVGTWGPGLLVAGLALGAIPALLGLLAPLRRAWLGPEAGRRLLGMTLLLGALLLLAGPWYLGHLEALRSCFFGNLGQAYDGELIPLAERWAFYPACLPLLVPLPLSLLALVGAGRAARGHGGPLVPVSLAVLASGVLVLTALPYPTARYLVPGLSMLAAPAALALEAPGLLPRVARWLLLAWLALFQLGGTPLAPGPARDLVARVCGDPQRQPTAHTRAGLAEALDRLPSWGGCLLGPQPSSPTPPVGSVVAALGAASSPERPWLAVLWSGQDAPVERLGLTLAFSAGPAGGRFLRARAPQDAASVVELARGEACGPGRVPLSPLIVEGPWRPEHDGGGQAEGLRALGWTELASYAAAQPWGELRLWEAPSGACEGP